MLQGIEQFGALPRSCLLADRQADGGVRALCSKARTYFCRPLGERAVPRVSCREHVGQPCSSRVIVERYEFDGERASTSYLTLNVWYRRAKLQH
jgi:hypothetical protein